MSNTALNNIVSRIKRLLNTTVISGTYTDTDLEYYTQDAVSFVENDYDGFGDYEVIIASGIFPVPTDLDSVLLSLKGASLANISLIQGSIADAIMVKAGSITLDTTKALRQKGAEADRIEKMYQNIIDNLLMDVVGASSIGSRIDNYISYSNEEKHAESLL
jgi:hypothetical protein